jgi:hypothetical protein
MQKLVKLIIILSITIIITMTIFPSLAGPVCDNINHVKYPEDLGLLLGIMYVYHIKKGWGWETRWQPIIIFRYDNNEWEILNLSSESFIPYGFNGLIGPRYRIHSYLVNSAMFFICANVKMWSESY